MTHKIIGTAGHIDHGKSSLVKALTGTDPDRLNEEKKRGMTIDLGFAFLNENIAFIDVPGHEKFIKNMVAGVSTIDMVLFVVAADDGVMPQTREHLDILHLLQQKNGIIALTKIDLVESDWLEIVEEDIKNCVKGTFLEKTPVLKVSTETGDGIDQLKETIIKTVQQLPARKNRGHFWMPVDRSFTIKGHGTVVTGSVLSGEVNIGEAVELLPKQIMLKVRSIQTHGKTDQKAQIGDRAALNLMNIGKDEIKRGDVLAETNAFKPSSMFDVKLSLLSSAPKALSHRTRVRLHIGTREILARVKLVGVEKVEQGQSCYAQLLLEKKSVAFYKEPFVIRAYSPPSTIGGGFVLQTNPAPHKRSDKNVLENLKKLEEQNPIDLLLTLLLAKDFEPVTPEQIKKETGINSEEMDNIFASWLKEGKIYTFGSKPLYMHLHNFQKVKKRIIDILKNYHSKNPLRPGLKRANLQAQTLTNPAIVFDKAIAELIEEQRIVETDQIIKLVSHKIELNNQDKMIAEKLLENLTQARFSTPPEKILAQSLNYPLVKVMDILEALQGMGKIIKLEGDIYLTTENLKKAQELLFTFAEKNNSITVGEFRELLETSRKYAMPLLLYFDDRGITERIGDVRVLKKAGA